MKKIIKLKTYETGGQYIPNGRFQVPSFTLECTPVFRIMFFDFISGLIIFTVVSTAFVIPPFTRFRRTWAIGTMIAL